MINIRSLRRWSHLGLTHCKIWIYGELQLVITFSQEHCVVARKRDPHQITSLIFPLTSRYCLIGSFASCHIRNCFWHRTRSALFPNAIKATHEIFFALGQVIGVKIWTVLLSKKVLYYTTRYLAPVQSCWLLPRNWNLLQSLTSNICPTSLASFLSQTRILFLSTHAVQSLVTSTRSMRSKSLLQSSLQSWF